MNKAFYSTFRAFQSSSKRGIWSLKQSQRFEVCFHILSFHSSQQNNLIIPNYPFNIMPQLCYSISFKSNSLLKKFKYPISTLVCPNVLSWIHQTFKEFHVQIAIIDSPPTIRSYNFIYTAKQYRTIRFTWRFYDEFIVYSEF